MKNSRKLIFAAAIIAVIMLFEITASAGTADFFDLYVNGSKTSEKARVIDGKIYVPVDDVFENSGTNVTSDFNSKTVYITNSAETVTEVVKSLSSSVVGIIGKLKPTSQNFSSYGDNLTFGTGVIYKSNGYILTNSHVVKDMESIVVVLSSGKAYKARLKAIDEISDLALIKIDKGGLKPAIFGDMSEVEPGMPVIAIGTPLSFSLRNSASKGIVSGINRTVDGEYRFIQSDAAINGGNSGGPLVNTKGEVIGINTVKYIGFGVEGLSFSIPVDTVKYVISHFEKYGKVRRPYLGAVFMEGVAARYGLPSNEGLTITDIEKDSSAEKAGLQVDDVIMAVNGTNITTKIDYNEEMKKYLPGDTVTLTIERKNEIIKMKVEFDEAK